MRLNKHNNFYFYLLIIIFIIIFITIFIIINNNNKKKKETFIHKIKSFYRPHVRNMRQHYEKFIDKYNLDTFTHKFNKWNIYST